MSQVSRTVTFSLKQFRDSEAKRLGCEPYMVLQNATIDLLAQMLPKTNLELLTIKGIGPAKAKKFGASILRIIEEASSKQEVAAEAPHAASSEQKVYSVGEFLDVLNRALSAKTVSIRGEITQAEKRGWNYYLTIKDKEGDAVLSCFVRESVVPQGVTLEPGQEIIVVGYPSIYKPSGRFSLTVEEILLSGEGLLLKAFEELKKKLEKEGFFKEERKRSISRFCRHIALITAKGSQAEKDFRKNICAQGLSIYHYDVRVQGAQSVAQVKKAIEWFNTCGKPIDVIVLIRGGGSLEDLQSFNAEEVARAIFASRIPIVCGVGHEGDISIADLVSDLRVSTPTAAARALSEYWEKADGELNSHLDACASHIRMLVSQAKAGLERTVDQYNAQIDKEFHKRIAYLREHYIKMHNGCFRTFEQFRRVETKFSNNISLLAKILLGFKREIRTYKKLFTGLAATYPERVGTNLFYLEEKLAMINPELKLKQGYSIVFGEDGKVIKSTSQIQSGQTITTKLTDGEITSLVN